MVTLLAIVAGVLLLFNLTLLADIKEIEKRLKAANERVDWCRSAQDRTAHTHSRRLAALEEFTERLKSATQGDS